MFSKNKLTLLLFLSLVTLLPTVSPADVTTDRKIVTSKAYVDSTKQNKIPAGTSSYYTNGSVLTYTDSAGTVGEKHILNATTWGFVLEANLNLSSAQRNTFLTTGDVYDGLTSAKAAVIPAQFTGDNAPTGRQTVYLTTTAGHPAVFYITSNGASGLTLKSTAPSVMSYVNGTTDLNTFSSGTFGSTSDLSLERVRFATVSLELLKDVYSALHTEIQNTTPTGTPGNVAMYDATTGALSDGVATYSGATAQNPYNATNDAAKIATAAAVETKQNKITATSDGTNNTPNYVYNATTNPTADGSVVTTTGTAGTVTQRGIANAAVYTTTNNVTTLANGDWIPNITALETKQNKKQCYDYETGHENDDNYCLLWLFPD